MICTRLSSNRKLWAYLIKGFQKHSEEKMIDRTFWDKTWLAAHSGKNHDWQLILGKHDWQHILGKNMSGSPFWEKNILGSKLLIALSGKNHDWKHILGKNIIGNTFWKKTWLTAHSGKTNIIGSTFWEENIIGSTSWKTPWLAAHSGKKHD